MFELMFDLQSYIDPILGFIKIHQVWAPLIVFALAFGESLAFISLLIPATALLLGVGVLIEAGGLNFWPIWIAAAVGATLGDAVSYWVGLYYKEEAKGFWPLNRHPDMVARAEQFFSRYGVWGVVIGRFFGPLRAVVPLIAGVLAMRQLPFQLANVGSAAVWSFAMLGPGVAVLKLMGW